MLGTRIAARRKKLGISQSQLARQLCISSSAVGMYEQGRREPSVEMLAALSRCLNVSIDYLVTGREWPPDSRQEEFIVLTGCTAHFREDGDFRPISDKELRTLLRELLWGD